MSEIDATQAFEGVVPTPTATWRLCSVAEAVELGTTLPRSWFRGHPQPHGWLTPAIFRARFMHSGIRDARPQLEVETVRSFQRDAPAVATSSLPAMDQSQQWLFVMQHYGAPTRLLDWTENPLIALHFASASSEHDGELWALNAGALNEQGEAGRGLPFPNNPALRYLVEEPFHATEVRQDLAEGLGLDMPVLRPVAFVPTRLFPRMLAQASTFTIHPRPSPGNTIPEVVTEASGLARYIVPRERKPRILEELAALGITHRSLFPDFEGLSRHIVGTEMGILGDERPDPPDFGREPVRKGGRLTLALLAAAFVPATASAQPPEPDHRLLAGPATVAFGHYDPLKPGVLTVRSGEVVEVTTMLTNSPRGLARMGLPEDEVQPELVAIYDEVTDRGPGGHILTGPIHVEEAEPGDVLRVDVLSVDLEIDYGYNGCSGFVRALCDEDARSRLIRMDPEGMTAEIAPGIVVPLRPFFGSMGVAPPPDSGRVSSNPPGRHAGNMDNKELVPGTTLYVPVWVPGALFQVGDGHAVQGDGEVNQTGLETSLRGRLRLTVLKDGPTLDWPRAETPTHHILMGFDPDLTRATEIAVREAVEFLRERAGLTSGEAYAVVSMAGDLRITELVDGNVGVHVMLSKAMLSG